ncbi:PIG-L deacetylase family protein [Actinomadura sp. NEAU-AAG7]|uniref:PIG-L deacetylase family protein n=1 Tax=Actinomadura sp. NEAU-AAG7 TaxID=2839640 RepID=UPI001BE4D787|nr:PIG-L deacetylase family protein [Actinomadura sp. NEAU-AAG7]MBT2209290.1 PIG-L family deacetylase [Actinomadura sp. NEAU-AAG7]
MRSHARGGAPLRLLVVGAHPDDIEIGAGALVAKAVRAGHEVGFLILTDDPPTAETRRREAVRAAAVLGVPQGLVHFAGLPDGRLRTDAATVQRVRDTMSGRRPDIVVVHTAADSHNDHVEAHRIAHAAFRGCVFMHYSVHVSGEPSRFRPRIFVAVAQDRGDAKRRALAAHESQQRTITRGDLADWERSLGSPARLPRAEAFELDLQAGAARNLRAAMTLSESPFHRLWLPVARDAQVSLLYPSVSGGGALSEVLLNAGRDALRQSFLERWPGPGTPLREVFAHDPDASRLFHAGNAILVGTPHTNPLVKDLHRKQTKTRWTVAKDERTRRAYIRDRRRPLRYAPVFSGDAPVLDFGVISRHRDRDDPGRIVLYTSGATPLGTRAGLEVLADPGGFANTEALWEQDGSLQLLFSVEKSIESFEVIAHHHFPEPL